VWSELRRWLRLPLNQKLLLAEAVVALALARLAILCLPFRRVANWLGAPGAETSLEAPAEDLATAEEIGWAISATALRTPWQSQCLAQALAGTWLLRRRRLEGTVSFGGTRGAREPFAAHAWLRFGPLIVTGGPEHEQFHLFTTFARKSR
jgi:hypothetical protein